jgi:WD40 repeat protein
VPGGLLTCLAVLPGGRELAAGQCLPVIPGRYAVRVLDIDTGEARLSLPGTDQVVYCLACSADGRLLVAGSEGGATVWGMPEGEVMADLRRTSVVRAATFAAGGRALALAEGRGATVWDLTTGEAHAALEGQEGLATAVAFGPDGRVLATAAWGGVVRLWATSGRLLAAYDWQIGRVHAVAFSPDGMRLAAGGDAVIVVWDVDV